ncbi:hypothetical protein GJA_1318 [Janthinobacterium agaricidamnosum NBRC 102515 = DSM 9628]|uniref:Uncharacterized protein n=1 Tax=Janthinobacterium agaricidamnosum NBRC 102515 = DSM 9628 TaxID=1349767 RepID=W0V287_9BURK|nr:hypothetical protein GJA_1318 [Janthinobacterium agaricidamnosum NBRC 102515 = DSM 9628]
MIRHQPSHQPFHIPQLNYFILFKARKALKYYHKIIKYSGICEKYYFFFIVSPIMKLI